MKKDNINNYLKKMKKSKIKMLVAQISVLVFFFVSWELLSKYEIIDEFLFSRPSAVVKLIYTYYKNNNLFNHIFISVWETVLGILIGTIGGIIIASLLWWNKKIAKVLDPFLIILNALPKTALAPIMIIWVGTGVSGIVVVAISILLIITIISAYNYFCNVEEEKIQMMKTFGANKYQIYTRYILPANLGNIISIFKINIGMAWVGVIVGEFLVSKAGIGHLIMYGGQVFRLDLVMMGVLILAICALIMYGIVNILEKIILKRREKEV